MKTFVSLGNATQPFPRLINAVLAVAPRLPRPILVQYGHTPFDGASDCSAEQFVGMDDFLRLTSEAELLILHAGAGSVIHAVQVGKVPVIMPRRAALGEHVDDHQQEMAIALAEAGLVVVAREANDLQPAVEEALRRQALPRAVNRAPRLLGLVDAALRAHAERLKR